MPSDNMYVEATDVKLLAAQVKERVRGFEHIDLDAIKFLRKSGGSGKYIARVRGLRGEVAMLSDHVYIITVVADNYDNLSAEGKEKVIEHELMHIPLEFDGKCTDHNIKDFRRMIEQYGLNYVHGTDGPADPPNL